MGKYAPTVVERGDTSWTDRAACTGTNPDVFFPRVITNVTQVEQAKRICRGCPVRAECLQDALLHTAYDDEHGIYGGLTPAERNRHRRHQNGCGCTTTVPVPEEAT